MGTRVGHFQIIPRGRRVRPIIRAIRHASRRFRDHHATGDAAGMAAASERAWNAMPNLFEILRNEQDQKRLDDRYMQVDTGWQIDGLSAADQSAIVAAGKVRRSRADCERMDLRTALNRAAHFDTAIAGYRIDGRGAHYVVLGGEHRKRRWVAEILVSTLCKNASAAATAIRF